MDSIRLDSGATLGRKFLTEPCETSITHSSNPFVTNEKIVSKQRASDALIVILFSGSILATNTS